MDPSWERHLELFIKFEDITRDFLLLTPKTTGSLGCVRITSGDHVVTTLHRTPSNNNEQQELLAVIIYPLVIAIEQGITWPFIDLLVGGLNPSEKYERQLG